MKYYSKEHEWVEIEDGIATVGITVFAAEELGDVTYVELPPIGEEFEQGEAMCVIESVKAASDVFAPLTGKVGTINESLADSPELVNESPEEDGWICKLDDVDEAETDNLMSLNDYNQYIADEKGDDVDEEEEE
jgi:glycine cleavage system H protein